MDQLTIELPEASAFSPDEAAAREIISKSMRAVLADEWLSEDTIRFSRKSSFMSVSFLTDNNLLCRVRFLKTKRYVELPAKYEEEAAQFGQIEKSQGSRENPFFKLLFNTLDDLAGFTPLFAHVLQDTIANYPAEFGCCSRYEECSDAKRCVNPDQNLRLQCYYRKNLRRGLIFYGKNKLDPGEYTI